MSRLSKVQNKALVSFIVQNIEKHKNDIGRFVASEFHVSRQTVGRHLRTLVREGVLRASGRTRAREYELVAVENMVQVETAGLEEDVLWRETIMPLVRPAPENVLHICAFGFTEMVNNAVDHSGSENLIVKVVTTAATITLIIVDHGVGIFNKVQKDHHLHDPRHALLELSKGKLTSDKSKHAGEGIFFTSRMFDKFMIESGELAFCRFNDKDDWLLQVDDTTLRYGTTIYLKISKAAEQTAGEIQDRFALPSGDFDFSRTHVPIKLAVYEGESLISRSQAKRLLARVDKFREVWLDFSDVETIGQAFADEIFRIFVRDHPGIGVIPMHAKPQIQGMITRVQFSEAASLLEEQEGTNST